MKRFLTLAVLLACSLVNAKSVIPTDSFEEHKETLYSIRIKMAYFLKMLEDQKMEAPAVLNQLSSVAQELINTIEEIENNNDFEGTIYSLMRIINNDIVQFKKALQTTKTLPNIDNFTQDAIKNIETITQEILSLMPKNIRSQ